MAGVLQFGLGTLLLGLGIMITGIIFVMTMNISAERQVSGKVAVKGDPKMVLLIIEGDMVISWGGYSTDSDVIHGSFDGKYFAKGFPECVRKIFDK